MSELRGRVAAIQMASSPKVSANLLEAERLVGQAVEAGAEMAVLPENFAFIGKAEEDKLRLREEDGSGPLQDFLVQTAKRFGVWLVGGTIPLAAKHADKVRAACLILDDKGERVGRYDKMHLFDVELPEQEERYAESQAIEPGDGALVLDTPFGRLGVAVCYDLRFPELFRFMLDQGMEVVALPSAFTRVTGQAHWEVLVRARAVENLVYVVAAAQGGYHRSGRETYGHSMIVGPWGTLLAEAQSGTGFIHADLDRKCQANLRQRFPALSHRRLKCE